jgi:hypothetical protein
MGGRGADWGRLKIHTLPPPFYERDFNNWGRGGRVFSIKVISRIK